jgi:hypothetical protein
MQRLADATLGTRNRPRVGPLGLGWVPPGFVLCVPVTTLLAMAWVSAMVPVASAGGRHVGDHP